VQICNISCFYRLSVILHVEISTVGSDPVGSGRTQSGRSRFFKITAGRIGSKILEIYLFFNCACFLNQTCFIVLLYCSLYILLVHVMFTRLYIFENKFNNTSMLIHCNLKIQLFSVIVRWSGRAGQCFACDKRVGSGQVGNFAGLIVRSARVTEKGPRPRGHLRLHVLTGLIKPYAIH